MCCDVLSVSVMSDSLRPHGLQPTRLLCPWTIAQHAPLSMGILQERILKWVAMPSSGDLPNPGIESRFPPLQAVSLPSEPPGKPRNTGVGSLSLLQRNFLAQDSNWGLLHCRWILYQLSYYRSPLTKDLSISSICRNLAFGFMGFPYSYAGLYHYVIDLCSKIYYLLWVFSA